MNSIKEIVLPDYEALMNCIYDKFLFDAGQEFDYENYDKALDKAEQIASDQDYNELECYITDSVQNSARHGFLMGARMTMMILFGWQQGSGMQGIGNSLQGEKRRTGTKEPSGSSPEI